MNQKEFGSASSSAEHVADRGMTGNLFWNREVILEWDASQEKTSEIPMAGAVHRAWFGHRSDGHMFYVDTVIRKDYPNGMTRDMSTETIDLMKKEVVRDDTNIHPILELEFEDGMQKFIRDKKAKKIFDSMECAA